MVVQLFLGRIMMIACVLDLFCQRKIDSIVLYDVVEFFGHDVVEFYDVLESYNSKKCKFEHLFLMTNKLLAKRNATLNIFQ